MFLLSNQTSPNLNDPSAQAKVLIALRIDIQENHADLLEMLGLPQLTAEEVHTFVVDPKNRVYLAMGIYIGYSIVPFFDVQAAGTNGRISK